MEGAMKKFIGVLVGVMAALAAPAAAQGPVQNIAYDFCWSDYQSLYSDGATFCNVYLARAVVGDATSPTWSPDGSRIAFLGYSQPGMFVLNLSDWSLVSLTATGGGRPTWSPDGLKLAFSSGQTGRLELYVINADGSGITQLTDNVGVLSGPVWSPDGHRMAFDCEVESGNRDICAISADGTSLVRLTTDPASQFGAAWSSDGRTIAFDCEVESGNRDICAISADAAGLVRLTTDPAWDSSAAFSPDGLRIAFHTNRYGAGAQIAVMNVDGADVTPVAEGGQFAWSPDGSRIVFVVPFTGACEADGRICPDSIHIVNRDGSGLMSFAYGDDPAWASSTRPVAWFESHGCNGLACGFDGSGSWGGNTTIASYAWTFGDGMSDSGPTVTHAYAATGRYTVTLTVTDDAGVTGTQSQVLDVVDNTWPTASFTYACSGLRCTFDGLGSWDPDGSITNYFWSFGDGETGGSAPGPTVSHTYSASGTFTATLIVTDNFGATGKQQRVLSIVNAAPVVSSTLACSGLTCNFDGSGSSDTDGTIAIYVWSFGDGTASSGQTVTHTYNNSGNYTMTLTVTDNGGATSTQAQSVTVAPPDIHVGDLDGASTSTIPQTWTATVTATIHDSDHRPVANAVVSGSWSNGSTASCTTTASGQCAVSKSGILKKTSSVSFAVTTVARVTFVYRPADNHDPDGDSNGTTVSVAKR
jgi:Tol biopolymer transport system component/PKD repeat protein